MNKRIDVLDHGYVELLSVQGDDEFLAQTARTSTESSGDPDKDRGLVRRLVRDRHTSPIEFGTLIFEIQMPIFVARQLMRHRTGAFNEFSMRYSEAPDVFYIPDDDRMQEQSTFSKQGSAGRLPDDVRQYCQEEIRYVSSVAYKRYRKLRDAGLTRELARCVLPVNIYTKVRWKLDLHNLMHFLKLREDKHAQFEIRVFANAIHEFAKEAFPVAIKAYEDFVQNKIEISPHLAQKLASALGRISDLDEDMTLTSEERDFMMEYDK